MNPKGNELHKHGGMKKGTSSSSGSNTFGSCSIDSGAANDDRGDPGRRCGKGSFAGILYRYRIPNSDERA